MKEAMFYHRLEGGDVKCDLCNHRCHVRSNGRGICYVRENKNGVLYTLVYGKLISRAVDPVEKKPLFHFYPGSSAYSIATVGCNFRCLNCQNYEISQMPRETKKIVGEDATPESVVEEARLYRSKSIAYTYTEPTVFYEFAYDVARLASKEGIRNVFVTNGYITEEALKEIRPYLDAANIDLKGFSDEFYRKNCGARLDLVLDTIRSYKKMGIWIELTTLLIPTLNDDEAQLKAIADFIVNLDPGIPWHISRFYPMYKLLDLPETPMKSLDSARRIGIEAGLRYVYQGNVPGSEGENTYCHRCGELLIHRYGYRILEYKIKDGQCPRCGVKIDGVWT
ncbi:MAG: AmmeMemoRadiSam system radical SAM enzyme [Candidatus Bathyarchaeia archaeon]